jgi:hypothetical protein
VLAESGSFGPAVPVLGTGFGVAKASVPTRPPVGWATSRSCGAGRARRDAIAARAGLSARRILSVPVGAIEEISPTDGASSALGTEAPRRPAAGAIGVGSCDPKNGRSEVEIWPDRFTP